jgi:hypothetical protein
MRLANKQEVQMARQPIPNIRPLIDRVHAAFRRSSKKLSITEKWLFSKPKDPNLSDEELERLYLDLSQLLELLERFNNGGGWGGGEPPPQNQRRRGRSDTAR